MKAYVLAAGYATRLHPLTRDRPKPLLDVGGAPVLTRIVRRICASTEVDEIIVIANHRFREHFTAWATTLDVDMPLRVLNDGSMSDDDKLGAVADLAFALEQAPLGNDDALVVAGDNLIDFDLEPLRALFATLGTPVLALRRVRHGPGATAYNEVVVDDDHRVLGFREKPLDPQSDLSAIAMYFFPPELGDWLARYLAGGGNPDAPGHFIAWLVDETPVHGMVFDGDWYDIGSLEALEAARRRLPSPRTGKGVDR